MMSAAKKELRLWLDRGWNPHLRRSKWDPCRGSSCRPLELTPELLLQRKWPKRPAKRINGRNAVQYTNSLSRLLNYPIFLFFLSCLCRPHEHHTRSLIYRFFLILALCLF